MQRVTLGRLWAVAALAVVAGLASAQARAEEGFVPLFNGVDLTGWTGDTRGYWAEDGVLAGKPLGNLYTEAQYGDFILRFEFKLTPGANNGIGIRVPLKRKASTEGMEIQILDDTSEEYKDIKPYQYHGSIYRRVGLSELLRVVQFYNLHGYGCEPGEDDGYMPGDPDRDCAPHDSDYAPQDWRIALGELMRLIQFYNLGGYHACDAGEDGYCPGIL